VEVLVYQNSRQPCRVLGDFLPEQIQEQLKWLLQVEAMGNELRSKASSPLNRYRWDRETPPRRRDPKGGFRDRQATMLAFSDPLIGRTNPH
jgi:hypothetical protein